MKLRGNVFVVGKVGPFPIDAAGIVDEVVERMKSGGPEANVGIRVNGTIVVGRVSHAEVVVVTPEQRGVTFDLDVDEALLAPGPLEALTAATEQLGDQVEARHL